MARPRTPHSRPRFIEVDGGRLPLKSVEVTLLACCLHLAKECPELVAEEIARRDRGQLTPDLVRIIAGGLNHWLLAGTIKERGDIARWRQANGFVARAPVDDFADAWQPHSAPRTPLAAPIAAVGDPWAEEAERRLAKQGNR